MNKELIKKLRYNCLDFVKRNVEWIIGLLCLIIFFVIIEDVLDSEIMVQDLLVYDFFSNHLIGDNLTPIMKIITQIGSAYCILIFLIITFLFLKNKKLKITITTNLILVTLFNQILKRIVERPRPDSLRIVEANGYSFPSGHSMVSMAFYGYFIYLSYKYIKNKYLRNFSICLLTIMIIMIGVSRIYLGVHYTSDVIAGFTLSLFYLIIFVKASNKYLNE